MLGIEPTTFRMTTRPGTGPIKILQRKFYATRFFKHFDWMQIIFNQSKCLKKIATAHSKAYFEWRNEFYFI